jgi:mannose-6-phosphate isomerase
LKHNSVKNYDWGSHNPECYVCKLSKTKPNPTAAELWMGTHPKGESQLENQQGLSEYLKQKELQPLEFLFKVLSIEKCLSIQIHPNK